MVSVGRRGYGSDRIRIGEWIRDRTKEPRKEDFSVTLTTETCGQGDRTTQRVSSTTMCVRVERASPAAAAAVWTGAGDKGYQSKCGWLGWEAGRNNGTIQVFSDLKL